MEHSGKNPPSSQLSRRDFLKIGCVTALSQVITKSGLPDLSSDLTPEFLSRKIEQIWGIKTYFDKEILPKEQLNTMKKIYAILSKTFPPNFFRNMNIIANRKSYILSKYPSKDPNKSDVNIQPLSITIVNHLLDDTIADYVFFKNNIEFIHGELDFDTFIHELGHAIHYAYGDFPATYFNKSIFNKTQSSELPESNNSYQSSLMGFPSSYALKNNFELFAESFAQFFRKLTKTKSILRDSSETNHLLYNGILDILNELSEGQMDWQWLNDFHRGRVSIEYWKNKKKVHPLATVQEKRAIYVTDLNKSLESQLPALISIRTLEPEEVINNQRGFSLTGFQKTIEGHKVRFFIDESPDMQQIQKNKKLTNILFVVDDQPSFFIRMDNSQTYQVRILTGNEDYIFQIFNNNGNIEVTTIHEYAKSATMQTVERTTPHIKHITGALLLERLKEYLLQKEGEKRKPGEVLRSILKFTALFFGLPTIISQDLSKSGLEPASVRNIRLTYDRLYRRVFDQQSSLYPKSEPFDESNMPWEFTRTLNNYYAVESTDHRYPYNVQDVSITNDDINFTINPQFTSNQAKASIRNEQLSWGSRGMSLYEGVNEQNKEIFVFALSSSDQEALEFLFSYVKKLLENHPQTTADILMRVYLNGRDYEEPNVNNINYAWGIGLIPEDISQGIYKASIRLKGKGKKNEYYDFYSIPKKNRNMIQCYNEYAICLNPPPLIPTNYSQ